MKPCPACGTDNNPFVESCVACEANLASASEAAAQSLADMTPEAHFVGENYAYYQRRWEAMNASDGYVSWNWAAFFFTPYWLLYRRLYLYFAIYAGAVLSLIGGAVLLDAEDASFQAIGIALSGVAGSLGNYGYRLHVQRRIASLSATATPERMRAALVRDGGTSGAAPALLFIGMVLLTLASFSAPG